jgi:uncharacterized membrane protein SirB2
MLIKIIHMSAGMLTVLLFIVQAVLLLKRRMRMSVQPGGKQTKIAAAQGVQLAHIIKLVSHAVWLVLILAGLWLLVHLPIYPYWIFAKIGLFVLAIVFSVFAFRSKNSVAVQNIGLLGGALCYGAILYLIVAQPFGFLLTSSANQPVSGSVSPVVIGSK